MSAEIFLEKIVGRALVGKGVVGGTRCATIMPALVDTRIIGGVSGAAIGGALGVLSGGRKFAVGATIGAAIGTACGHAIEKRKAEPRLRTFEDVGNEDAIFRAAAEEEMKTVDYDTEADVLRSFFIGQRSAKLENSCEKLQATAKLESTRGIFQPWATATPAYLAVAIQKVVEDLEAPHLLPTGIARRLDSGVDAACFGLFTLLAHAAFDLE